MNETTERERLIGKLSDSMDPDNARAFVDRVIEEALKGHDKGTPEAVQAGDYCVGCVDAHCRHEPWCVAIRIDTRKHLGH